MSKVVAMNERQISTDTRRRTVSVLRWQYLDTLELRAHVEEARASIATSGRDGNIVSMLDGMSEELRNCGLLLNERISDLSPGSARLDATPKSRQTFWRLFKGSSGCSEQLEALLSGYLHYAKAASTFIGVLEVLGDVAGVQIMKKIFEAADSSIWFLSLSMERIALLGIDNDSLPRFTPIVTARQNGTVHSFQ